MKLQRREKILAAVAGGMTLLIGLWLLFSSGGTLSYSRLLGHRDQLETDVAKKEREVKTAEAAARNLVQWRRRALPSDAAEAKVRYHTWLRDLADRVQFQQSTVKSIGVESKKTFTLLKFSVGGQTDLAKLTEFLHAFYSAGHLHQISLIDIKTVPKSNDLKVNIEVEAISLPGTDRTNKLTEEPGKSLRLAKPADYAATIVKRDMFHPVMRQPVPDLAQSTFITAIMGIDGRGEAWLVERNSGKDWKFHEGERVEVGLFQGTVKSIGKRDMVIDVAGRLRRFRSGDNLRGGEEMPKP